MADDSLEAPQEALRAISIRDVDAIVLKMGSNSISFLWKVREETKALAATGYDADNAEDI